jgi:hypothetical protein
VPPKIRSRSDGPIREHLLHTSQSIAVTLSDAHGRVVAAPHHSGGAEAFESHVDDGRDRPFELESEERGQNAFGELPQAGYFDVYVRVPGQAEEPRAAIEIRGMITGISAGAEVLDDNFQVRHRLR